MSAKLEQKQVEIYAGSWFKNKIKATKKQNEKKLQAMTWLQLASWQLKHTFIMWYIFPVQQYLLFQVQPLLLFHA